MLSRRSTATYASVAAAARCPAQRRARANIPALVAVLFAAVTLGSSLIAAEPEAAVRRLDTRVLSAKPASQRAGRLMQAYYDSILDWGEILREQTRPVPGHPDWIYYGQGGHGQEVRAICYAAIVNAFLAEVPPPRGDLIEVPGFNVTSVLTLFTEVGADLSPFRCAPALPSWLGLLSVQ